MNGWLVALKFFQCSMVRMRTVDPSKVPCFLPAFSTCPFGSTTQQRQHCQKPQTLNIMGNLHNLNDESADAVGQSDKWKDLPGISVHPNPPQIRRTLPAGICLSLLRHSYDFSDYEDGKYTALSATFCAHCPSSLLEMVLTDFKKQALHDNEHNWEFRMADDLKDCICEFFCRQILLQVLEFLDGRQGMVSSEEGPCPNWVPSHPMSHWRCLWRRSRFFDAGLFRLF